MDGGGGGGGGGRGEKTDICRHQSVHKREREAHRVMTGTDRPVVAVGLSVCM